MLKAQNDYLQNSLVSDLVIKSQEDGEVAFEKDSATSTVRKPKDEALSLTQQLASKELYIQSMQINYTSQQEEITKLKQQLTQMDITNDKLTRAIKLRDDYVSRLNLRVDCANASTSRLKWEDTMGRNDLIDSMPDVPEAVLPGNKMKAMRKISSKRFRF